MLAPRPPFSLSSVIDSHGWVQLAPFERTETGFTYVDRLATGRLVRLAIGETPGGVSVSTAVKVDGAEAREIAEKVSWMVGLEQDFTPFYALAAVEPKLRSAQLAAKGRVLRCPTLFEDTLKTILTTNTQWGGTKRMVRTLVERYGDPLDMEDGTAGAWVNAFPTPERLAQAGPEELRNEAKLGYRAPSVAALARSVASGELDLEGLKHSSLSTPELRKQLLSIKGVGPYAAANLLMILGRYDAIPIDSWALSVVSKEFHGGRPVGPAEVEAAFEAWGEWKGLAYWFWEYGS
ncbi:MAG: DNA-3-methyladenine glycosylase family protein [Nitrososphaerales archaeon]